MRRRIRHALFFLTMLAATAALTTQATPVEAAATIRFTTGPGTGAPPSQLGILALTSFPADDRPVGETVESIGPMKLSSPAIHHRIGDGWSTWSHGYTGDVYQTDGLSMTLPKKTAAFYFYAEPNAFAELTISATTDNGTTSRDIAVQGDSGAQFFGFYSTKPLSDYIKSISVSSPETFAIGEFGITSNLGRYVALGDSYSSGEGTGDYTNATKTTENRCHRSGLSYATALADADKSLRPLGFVACSGSLTSDLGARNHLYKSEDPQYDALSSLTKTVTLTIGGNDAGFVDVLGACLKARDGRDGRGCSTNSKITGAADARIGALNGDGTGVVTAPGGFAITPIAEVIATIHGRAPNAKIYIGGYPELFGSRKRDFTSDDSAPSGYACKVNTVAIASLDYTDTQWINKEARQLNKVIKGGVTRAKAADKTVKAYYVDPSNFDGHGVCDSSSRWINKLILIVDAGLAPASESFHPNRTGQRSGYSKAFKKKIL